MSPDYDVLIAGAGPAGCAAAYDLATAGKRVLLLDRRTFPRPKACACGLTRKTLKTLRYSVDPVIERVCHEIVLQRSATNSGAPFMTASSSWVGSADKSAEVRIRSRNPICAMAVRDRFDDFCLQQTLASGSQGGSATLLKIETISALRELPTHIELDILTASGPQTLRAPLLIGADGSNGQTRRLAEALATQNLSSRPERSAVERPAVPPATTSDPTWYTRGFALEALIPYAALPQKLPAGDAPQDLVFDFSPIPGGYGWLFPKGDHINIGVGAFAPADNPDQLKAVTRQLLTTYAHQKLGLTQLDNITGQHLGMGGHAYIPRGRVLLTGDAAGLVDPLTGEGIHSAIISGQAAAVAILSNEADVAAAYARHLAPLQQTLAFSHRAARAFYREPERGFRAMKLPILRSLILKTYADGLPHTRLLTALAKLV
jgi:flavin-dependent dehydrogenase